MVKVQAAWLGSHQLTRRVFMQLVNFAILTVTIKIYQKFTSLSVQETLSKSSALKGLFLMACGTTFTNDAHFAVLKGLVES
jgi:hypothetical protein